MIQIVQLQELSVKAFLQYFLNSLQRSQKPYNNYFLTPMLPYRVHTEHAVQSFSEHPRAMFGSDSGTFPTGKQKAPRKTL